MQATAIISAPKDGSYTSKYLKRLNLLFKRSKTLNHGSKATKLILMINMISNQVTVVSECRKKINIMNISINIIRWSHIPIYIVRSNICFNFFKPILTLQNNRVELRAIVIIMYIVARLLYGNMAVI